MCSRRLRQTRSQPRLCSSPPSSAWELKPASQLSEDELNGNWRKVVEPLLVVKHKEQSGQIRILTKLSAQSGSSYKQDRCVSPLTACVSTTFELHLAIWRSHYFHFVRKNMFQLFVPLNLVTIIGLVTLQILTKPWAVAMQQKIKNKNFPWISAAVNYEPVKFACFWKPLINWIWRRSADSL